MVWLTPVSFALRAIVQSSLEAVNFRNLTISTVMNWPKDADGPGVYALVSGHATTCPCCS